MVKMRTATSDNRVRRYQKTVSVNEIRLLYVTLEPGYVGEHLIQINRETLALYHESFSEIKGLGRIPMTPRTAKCAFDLKKKL